MPIPPDAEAFAQALDPSEQLDYGIDLERAADGSTLLQPGENVASYTLALSAEAIAAGLTIMEGDGRDHAMNGDTISMWFKIDDEMQSLPAFNGAGLSLAGELTLVTTSTPARTRQRTWVVRVANQ